MATTGMEPDDWDVLGEARAPWPLRLFGEHALFDLFIPRGMTQQELDEVRALFPEAKIDACFIRESPVASAATQADGP